MPLHRKAGPYQSKIKHVRFDQSAMQSPSADTDVTSESSLNKVLPPVQSAPSADTGVTSESSLNKVLPPVRPMVHPCQYSKLKKTQKRSHGLLHLFKSKKTNCVGEGFRLRTALNTTPHGSKVNSSEPLMSSALSVQPRSSALSAQPRYSSMAPWKYSSMAPWNPPANYIENPYTPPLTSAYSRNNDLASRIGPEAAAARWRLAQGMEQGWFGTAAFEDFSISGIDAFSCLNMIYQRLIVHPRHTLHRYSDAVQTLCSEEFQMRYRGWALLEIVIAVVEVLVAIKLVGIMIGGLPIARTILGAIVSIVLWCLGL